MTLVNESLFKNYMLNILFILLIPFQLFAEISLCGNYQINGVIRKLNSDRVLVVNEKTQSEHHVYFDVTHQPELAIYDNKDITAIVTLEKKFNGTSGSASNLLSIKSRIPNPLMPKDTHFTLIKEAHCKN